LAAARPLHQPPAMRRVLLVVVVMAGCFYEEASPLPDEFGICAEPPDDTAGVAAPTWYRDVEPIVVAKCQGCHTDGGIAPFSLASYGEVVALAPMIRDAVGDRRMPPWQPDACCNHYLYDRSLTDADRGTLLRWLDTVAEGDPADAPPSAPPPQGLPRVDLRATMPVPFTPAPQVGSDELRCFLLDHAPIEVTRYITGFDFQPGARGEVHHVIVFAVDEDEAADFERRDGADGRPGWDCYGNAGELMQSGTYIGGWQPGVLPRILPDGIGRELKAHTRIALNVHYDTGHGIAPDLSAIDIMLADSVDRIERGIPIGNPLWFVGDGMAIDANDPDASVWFAWDPSRLITKNKSVEIHNVMLHMHELGSIGRVAILRGDGTTECLLNITQWDFHWLADYYFATPVRLDPGDQLYVECHWDNTAANQKIVNGVQQQPRTLHWGTDEEMCGAVLTYSEAL
jgi:hypothetical protein